ncbi:MAG: hypothetical protein M1812_000113 [Candelaria pacifica]|nr:MAG: hypothetical protein M1812_000113 [Candelaria pacifica]
MPPVSSQSWYDMWNRRSGTAGALIRDDPGSRERISDPPRPQSPPRALSYQSQNWGGTNQGFAPLRPQRGTWKPPRGSQYRTPQEVRPRSPPRTQATTANLRERNRSSSPRKLPSGPHTASYAHPWGPPSLRGRFRTPHPLPADHPLMTEMAELKITRKNRQQYWAGLIPNLGDEWANPASYDRQQWEQETTLADEKLSELAGQIKMAEMGMPEEMIGYAQDETRGASTAPLKGMRYIDAEMPPRPNPDGAYRERIPDIRHGRGMPHPNQETHCRTNQIDRRNPHGDVTSHHAGHQTERIIPRQYQNSRDIKQPPGGGRTQFVSKQAKSWTEKEKDSNIRKWVEDVGLAIEEDRNTPAGGWMDERPWESPEGKYMIDIGSGPEDGGSVRPANVDNREYNASASLESGEIRVEPESHEVSGQVGDGLKTEARTGMGELGAGGQIEQTPEAIRDDQGSIQSFESFKSLRYSIKDEDVGEQWGDSDERVFEEAEEVREIERVELGRCMTSQEHAGSESTKTGTKVTHAELKDTSVDITPVYKGALPPHRTPDFQQARLNSTAIPAPDHHASSYLKPAQHYYTFLPSSSIRTAPQSCTVTSSNLTLPPHKASDFRQARLNSTALSALDRHAESFLKPAQLDSKVTHSSNRTACASSSLTSSNPALPSPRAVDSRQARLSSTAIPALDRNAYLEVSHSPSIGTAPELTTLPSSNLALPPHRASDFGQSRFTSIAIPAFQPKAYSFLKPSQLNSEVLHASSARPAIRSSTLTSSNRARHQTEARNSHTLSSSANYLNLHFPKSSTQRIEALVSQPSRLDTAATYSYSDSLSQPTSRPRLTAASPNAVTSSSLQQLNPRSNVRQHRRHRSPVSLGFTLVNNTRVEIIDMSSYSTESSLTTVPSITSIPSDMPSDDDASVPAVLGKVNKSKFHVTGPNRRGVVRHFAFKHQANFDWNSADEVSTLNKWRGQVIRRTTGRNARDPVTKYLPAENDFIIAVHRKAKDEKVKVDWAEVAKDFNAKFDGKIIEGSDKPRPARGEKALLTQRDRIEEVRVLRGKPDARKKERERKIERAERQAAKDKARGKGKAKSKETVEDSDDSSSLSSLDSLDLYVPEWESGNEDENVE